VIDVKKQREEIETRLLQLVHGMFSGSGIDSAELKILVPLMTALESATLARLKFESSERAKMLPPPPTSLEVRNAFRTMFGKAIVP